MSIELRKIPNQESLASQLLNTTVTVQGPEQHPLHHRHLHPNPSTLRELPVRRQGASSENTKFLLFQFVNIFNAGLQIDADRNVQTDYLIAGVSSLIRNAILYSVTSNFIVNKIEIKEF